MVGIHAKLLGCPFTAHATCTQRCCALVVLWASLCLVPRRQRNTAGRRWLVFAALFLSLCRACVVETSSPLANTERNHIRIGGANRSGFPTLLRLDRFTSSNPRLIDSLSADLDV